MKKIISLIIIFVSTNIMAASYDVDEVHVYKTRHIMEMRFKGKVTKFYNVMLGRGGMEPKVMEGDLRVPEGKYMLDFKNPYSKFYRSIHISYPNKMDIAHARKLGVKPGGEIFIHGMPNLLTELDKSPDGESVNKMLGILDWTAGCVAVTNSEMTEIYLNIEAPTPIEIFH